MFKQYNEIKSQHRDAILFFRMGDFYEMFFEDAIEASNILNIALTSRSKGDDQKVPMCGVPAHSAEPYIVKLVRAGKKIAICEQMEESKASKGLVRREVIRVVTPGLITEEEGLSPNANNYLVAVNPSKKLTAPWGISYIDISTGEFKLTNIKGKKECIEEIFRLFPSELLLPENIEHSLEFKHFIRDLRQLFPNTYISWKEAEFFDFKRAKQLLSSHFKVNDLSGFGINDSHKRAICASGALLFYIKDAQKGILEHIRSISPYYLDDYLIIDEASKRNLELVTNNIDGGHTNTLLSVLDYTITPMGGRLLRKWLLYPLISDKKINERLDIVSYFVSLPKLRQEAQGILKRIKDIERLISRAAVGSALPKDFIALKESLAAISELRALFKDNDACKAQGDMPALLCDLIDNILPLSGLCSMLKRAIREDAPTTLRDGQFIKKGFNKELDELIALQEDSRSILTQLEERERAETSIPTLKVGYNRVFGYYIEVTKTHKDKVPECYIRKQTLTNAERYITEELKEIEQKLLTAQERRIALEIEIFKDIVAKLIDKKREIQQDADIVAQLDAFISLSECAQRNSYCRPNVDNKDRIELREMRHPVVEGIVGKDAFVPNNLSIGRDNERFLIITGPNMAGKSTVLRSTALIVLMAQMGSFVPCSEANIGVVDRIFTRVGATDYLAKGQSTFMVEMTETANILHNATSKSLVILDEIGRGTSTYDGLAIAWAVSEELINLEQGRGVKTLFATHYHELTALQHEYKGVKNLSVGVKEWGDEIIFLYSLKDGPSNKSYGIHVAALSGMPSRVVERAQVLLEKIEKGEVHTNNNLTYRHIAKGTNPTLTVKKATQLALPLSCPKDYHALKEIGENIKKIDINSITPLEALNFLAMLKEKASDLRH